MKTTLLFLALSLFSHPALAGTYDFSCSNSDGSIRIGKGVVTIGDTYEYLSTLENFFGGFHTDDESGNNTVRITAAGPQKIISDKTGKNKCGDAWSKTHFAQKIRIKSLNGNKVDRTDLVICRAYAEDGSC